MFFTPSQKHLEKWINIIRDTYNSGDPKGLIKPTDEPGIFKMGGFKAFLTETEIYFYPDALNAAPLRNAIHSYRVYYRQKWLFLLIMFVICGIYLVNHLLNK
jgi:hypothetical protein